MVPKEAEEQKVFVEWLKVHNYKCAHIPNGGKFPIQYRAKLKKLGVSPGVPDMMIIHPKGLVFIEMKRQKGGVVSEDQKGWINVLSEISNVQVFVARGADEAIKIISDL